MRILMVGWEYPPKNSGGLGVACQGIVEHLVDADWDVLLILPRDMAIDTAVDTFRTKKGKSYKVIFVRSRLQPYPESQAVDYKGDLISDTFRYADLIVDAVKSEEFDIIHVHDWLTVPAGIALKRAYGKPLVLHVHSTEFDRTAGGDPNADIEKIEQDGYLNADVIAAVSSYTKKILIDKYLVNEDRIRVVHNGIEKEVDIKTEINFLGNVPVVLFVGRLTIQKGPEYFIRLAEIVLKEKPEVIFVVMGDGDMYQSMIEFSAFRELSGSVLFAGFLRGVSKQNLFQRADALIMPSVSEPFGLVALEAAILGVPVIVSKTSGVSEVLPSAITVDYWDTDLAARNLLGLFSDLKKSHKIGLRLKAEAEKVSWDVSVDELKNIYQYLHNFYG